MARKRKDGKRDSGIQSKRGNLYIVTYEEVNNNGIITKKPIWKSTGLKDTPENVVKALEQRNLMKSIKKSAPIDRNISISALADYFLKIKKRDVTETTLYSYTNRCAVIKNYFGDTKAIDITIDDMKRFLDYLFIEKKMRPRSVKDVRCQLHALYDIAVKNGFYNTNPVDEAKISKLLKKQYEKKVEESDTFFDYDEINHFLQVVEDHPLYELFYFTVFFGLRREEVLGLKWSCINPRKHELTIEHTVAKAEKIIRGDHTKTEASYRTYPLEDDQLRILDHLREAEQENRRLFGSEYNDNDYIFKHPDGSLYFVDYPTKAFRRIIKAHPELPQYATFHGLRKSCVSLLVHRGYTIRDVQKWVGHKDYETTAKIYALIKEKESKKIIAKEMSNLIKTKKY